MGIGQIGILFTIHNSTILLRLLSFYVYYVPHMLHVFLRTYVYTT